MIPTKFKYIARIVPKELFHKPEMLNNGFSINQCTVLFDFIKEKMEVTYFTEQGKMTVRNLSIPEDKKSLIVKLKFVCPDELINKQIVDRNFIAT